MVLTPRTCRIERPLSTCRGRLRGRDRDDPTERDLQSTLRRCVHLPVLRHVKYDVHDDVNAQEARHELNRAARQSCLYTFGTVWFSCLNLTLQGSCIRAQATSVPASPAEMTRRWLAQPASPPPTRSAVSSRQQKRERDNDVDDVSVPTLADDSRGVAPSSRCLTLSSAPLLQMPGEARVPPRQCCHMRPCPQLMLSEHTLAWRSPLASSTSRTAGESDVQRTIIAAPLVRYACSCLPCHSERLRYSSLPVALASRVRVSHLPFTLTSKLRT